MPWRYGGGMLEHPRDAGMLDILGMQECWVPQGCRGMPENPRDMQGCCMLCSCAGGCLNTPGTRRHAGCPRDMQKDAECPRDVQGC